MKGQKEYKIFCPVCQKYFDFDYADIKKYTDEVGRMFFRCPDHGGFIYIGSYYNDLLELKKERLDN